MSDQEEKMIPEMSDLALEDVVSVLMGVAPEGEEIMLSDTGSSPETSDTT